MAYGPDVFTGGTPTTNLDVAANIFDDNEATSATANTGFPYWFKYDFGVGITKIVSQLRIYSYNDGVGNTTKDFTFEGSNNDVAWTTIYTGQNANNATGWQTFQFSNSTTYRYYKVNITTTWNGSSPNYCVIYEAEGMESLGGAGILTPRGFYWGDL